MCSQYMYFCSILESDFKNHHHLSIIVSSMLLYSWNSISLPYYKTQPFNHSPLSFIPNKYEGAKNDNEVTHKAKSCMMYNSLTLPQEQFSFPSGCIGTGHLFLQAKQNTLVFPPHVQLLQKSS